MTGEQSPTPEEHELDALRARVRKLEAALRDVLPFAEIFVTEGQTTLATRELIERARAALEDA